MSESSDDAMPWLDEDDDGPSQPHGLRFGEGQTRGGGRPKGALNRATIVKRVANKRHSVRIDGRKRTLSSLELVLHIIRTRAASGDVRAIDLLEKLRQRFTASASQRRPAVFDGGSDLSPDEWRAIYSDTGHSDEDILKEFPHLVFKLKKHREWQREHGERTVA